jgi:DNA-binding NarL/FixJ family response regulator
MNAENAYRPLGSLVRVLIVDDPDLWQDFIVERLQQHPDVRVVGFASDGLEAIQKVEELKPDLVLLDVFLPKLNGLETARLIREFMPELRILFLSSESTPQIVETAFRVGGCGYVSKMDAASGLLDGINSIFRGNRFISPSVMDFYEVSPGDNRLA